LRPRQDVAGPGTEPVGLGSATLAPHWRLFMSSLHLTPPRRTPRTFTVRAIASLALGLFVIIAACSLPPPVCGSGQTSCNGTCVDLTSSPANCGMCGKACDASAPLCSASMCSATCGAGLLNCSNACVNTATDPSNCGMCGTVCQGTACQGGMCQGVLPGTGGGTGTGGITGSGGGSGAVSGSGGGSGAVAGTGGTGTGGVPNSLIGGYHVHGDWAGFAFTFVDKAMSATIMPADFGDLVDQDGPYCVSGSVVGTPPDEDANGDPVPDTGYTSIAAVGFNVNQAKTDDAPVGTVASTGDGVLIDITVNSGETELRVQLEDGTDPEAEDSELHRWCANISVVDGVFNDTLPWNAFSTQCWGGPDDMPFDNRAIAKVIVYVPDPGEAGTTLPFDFCVNDLGPANVVSRGVGTVAASCNTNVTWSAGSVGDQYGQASTGDGKYQFQNNGWGWTGGGNHSVSLQNSNGFTLTSQTCNRTDDSPCSFPSIYIGTDADGSRTSGSGLPKLVSAITSAPTCMGWSAGGTPASHEFNVSYDVWFNTNAQATNASKFLMVWYRDPPSFQPGGAAPIATAVIGNQTWQVWHGPNHAQQDITSYVTMNAGGLAEGQTYSFDLKNFIDDAVERGYITPASDNLIAIMGGMEIWGGGQGASINGFSANVQ